MSISKRPLNAADAPAPPSHYAQAYLVENAQRICFVSGQIPVAADGSVPEGFEAQARQAWANVLAQLGAAQMTRDDLVKVTIFLSSRDFAMANRQIREEVLGAHKVALTVIVCEIFDSDWLLEIEAVAAS